MKEHYLESWTRRFRTDRLRQRRRAQKAREAARACARLLYKRYAVRKVYLFGSLKDPDGFHEWSDIDLAVEGLPSHLYIKALAELWRQLPPGMDLDLIPIEDAYPGLKKRLLEEGVPLNG